MTARIVSAVAFGLLLLAFFALARSHETEFLQESCEEGHSVIVIWMKESSSREKKSRSISNIQFDDKGIVVRLPPSYFAPSWDSIKLEIEYRDNRSINGMLVMYAKDYSQDLGNIDRSCWEKVKRFISRSGVRARLSERVVAK